MSRDGFRSNGVVGALHLAGGSFGRGEEGGGARAIHDEGEEDGRVEKVAFGAGTWRMRIHPSVETEAARGREGVSGTGHAGHCPGHGGSSNVGGPVP